MTPAEKMQKEIDDLRLERERRANELDSIDIKLDHMIALQRRVFGAEKPSGARAPWGEASKKLQEALAAAPPEGWTVAEIAMKLGDTSEAAKGTLKTKLHVWTKNKRADRVSTGRYRLAQQQQQQPTTQGE